SKATYMDGAVQRIIVSNHLLDAAGRVLRTCSGGGATPTSFDAVKTVYDVLGRVRRTTNPYNTTDPKGDIAPLPPSTAYDYHGENRVITTTLPDGNTTLTSYNGAVSIATDPVGRQRR